MPTVPFPLPPPDDISPQRVLVWLDRLRAGIAARDEVFVWELFGYREARVAPRVVLEEALSHVRAARASTRAPLAILRFAWMVERLADAGEPMPGLIPSSALAHGDDVPSPEDGDPPVVQLEFTWPHRGARRRHA